VLLASGSGKSTIATLLLRYYDPPVTSPLEEKGDSASGIFLAGNDLRDYNLRWLRSQIAVVSQEPVSWLGNSDTLSHS